MNTAHDSLLGRETAYPQAYDPSLLFPIARSLGRAAIGVDDPLPFIGHDRWHAYELSWLDPRGKPQVATATIVVPCDSPNLIESKSLKLYLNSLNAHRFDDHDIAMWGHPVEIYVQDVDEVQWFSGVYSLMQDKWIAQPNPPDIVGDDIDLRDVERKARTYARDIQRTVAALRARPSEREISRAKKIKARIRQLRRGGLERDGELSIENLAFKALRKIGALDILHTAMNNAYDISHSIG